MTDVDPQAPYCAACAHHGTTTHDRRCWAVGEVVDDEFNFDPIALAAALLEAREALAVSDAALILACRDRWDDWEAAVAHYR